MKHTSFENRGVRSNSGEREAVVRRDPKSAEKVSVTIGGRLSVDGKRLFEDKRVLRAIEKLSRL